MFFANVETFLQIFLKLIVRIFRGSQRMILLQLSRQFRIAGQILRKITFLNLFITYLSNRIFLNRSKIRQRCRIHRIILKSSKIFLSLNIPLRNSMATLKTTSIS